MGGGAPGVLIDLCERAGGGGGGELPAIRSGVGLFLHRGKCAGRAGRPRPPSQGPERSPGVGVYPRTLFPSRPSRATGQASCVQARRAAQQHLCRSVPNESTRMTAQHSEVNSHQPQPIGGQITCSRALQGVKASSRKWLSKTRSAQGA